MNKYIRVILACAVAFGCNAIVPATAAAASKAVRSSIATSVPVKTGAIRVVSTANATCQTIACPRYRLVGIAY